jgi:hypothetical protein
MSLVNALLVVIAWIICSLLSYGFRTGSEIYIAGWVHHGWEEATFDVVFGPIALFSTLMVYGGKFWAWRPNNKEERWYAYQHSRPNWSRYVTIDTFEG